MLKSETMNLISNKLVRNVLTNLYQAENKMLDKVDIMYMLNENDAGYLYTEMMENGLFFEENNTVSITPNGKEALQLWGVVS